MARTRVRAWVPARLGARPCARRGSVCPGGSALRAVWRQAHCMVGAGAPSRDVCQRFAPARRARRGGAARVDGWRGAGGRLHRHAVARPGAHCCVCVPCSSCGMVRLAICAQFRQQLWKRAEMNAGAWGAAERLSHGRG